MFSPDQHAQSFPDKNDAADPQNKNAEPSNDATSEDGFLQNDDPQFQATDYTSNDTATNTGTTEDTLDAALHNALEINHNSPFTGSNRADFYEANDAGESDAQQELDDISDNKDYD